MVVYISKVYKTEREITMFGENLRTLRKRAGYTQKECARLLGISTSAVGMYEQGRREPDQKLLMKMAETFEVSLDRLLGTLDNEVELDDMVESVINKLITEYTLTRNGKKLSPIDVSNVVNAIKVGVEVATKDIDGIK